MSNIRFFFSGFPMSSSTFMKFLYCYIAQELYMSENTSYDCVPRGQGSLWRNKRRQALTVHFQVISGSCKNVSVSLQIKFAICCFRVKEGMMNKKKWKEDIAKFIFKNNVFNFIWRHPLLKNFEWLIVIWNHSYSVIWLFFSFWA